MQSTEKLVGDSGLFHFRLNLVPPSDQKGKDSLSVNQLLLPSKHKHI